MNRNKSSSLPSRSVRARGKGCVRLAMAVLNVVLCAVLVCYSISFGIAANLFGYVIGLVLEVIVVRIFVTFVRERSEG